MRNIFLLVISVFVFTSCHTFHKKKSWIWYPIAEVNSNNPVTKKTVKQYYFMQQKFEDSILSIKGKGTVILDLPAMETNLEKYVFHEIYDLDSNINKTEVRGFVGQSLENKNRYVSLYVSEKGVYGFWQMSGLKWQLQPINPKPDSAMYRLTDFNSNANSTLLELPKETY